MLLPPTRVLTPELMDQPTLGRSEHEHALVSLGRANAVSRTAATLWPWVDVAARAARGRPLRILDVACGGGQVTVDLAARLQRAGIAAELVGCDMSPVALDFARTVAARRSVDTVRFAQLDALRDDWPGELDLVLCSLFLHHLTDDDAVTMLRRMKAAARHTVLVSDLCRSALGLAFAWVGCRLLSRSRVFHIDGERSVRAAFRTDEALALAARADLQGATIRRVWPERFVLTWTRGTT
jgi:2-polyprenyl-3-methyl-5-hydroxy-6-metoxy-1,4-benzoquinol methylase